MDENITISRQSLSTLLAQARAFEPAPGVSPWDRSLAISEVEDALRVDNRECVGQLSLFQ